jgi:hypothetical protein
MNQSSDSKPEDGAFVDLLESTSQAEESPFAASQTKDASAPAGATAADSASGAGEFDLESFSWDETPPATTTPDNKVFDDDFDSLFGDTKASTKE